VKCEAIFNRERLYQGEILWLLSEVWYGLCFLNFNISFVFESKNMFSIKKKILVWRGDL